MKEEEKNCGWGCEGEALGRHTGAPGEGEGRQLGGKKGSGGGDNGLLLEGDASNPFLGFCQKLVFGLQKKS